MELTFVNITPTHREKNKIVGTWNGQGKVKEVTVELSLHQFKPWIKVLVDGNIVHSERASEEDFAEFVRLDERYYDSTVLVQAARMRELADSGVISSLYK